MPSAMQGKRWCFTLNNPTAQERQRLSNLLADTKNEVDYGIYGNNESQQGLQGFVIFKKKKRFNAAKDLLGNARYHIELLSRGSKITAQQASDACEQGDFYKFGSLPKRSGQVKESNNARSKPSEATLRTKQQESAALATKKAPPSNTGTMPSKEKVEPPAKRRRQSSAAEKNDIYSELCDGKETLHTKQHESAALVTQKAPPNNPEKLPSKETLRIKHNESAALPTNKAPLVARLAADMFRQHSELYLKHAAVLERVASNPNDLESWMMDEETPESIATTLAQEETTTLAVKGYQSMLQVQKRVDAMERLMRRNGISKKAVLSSRKDKNKERTSYKDDPTTPFFWFLKEYSLRISESLNQRRYSRPVRTQVLNVWKMMNPVERRPYVQRAERVKTLKVSPMAGGMKPPPAVSLKTASLKSETEGKPKEPESDSDSSSSSSEGEGLLFNRKDAESSSAANAKSKGESLSEESDSSAETTLS